MSNKIQIILGILSILVAIGAWFFPITNQEVSNNGVLQINNVKQQVTKKATLKVKGANTDVVIKQGKFFYNGGTVESTNSETSIFINNQQLLEVIVKGSNINLYIDKSIRENIMISNLGSNINIEEI